MSLLHTTASGNAAVNAVVDLVDVGGGTAVISWTTSADAELCTTNLPNPSFGAAGASVAKQAALLGVPLTSSGASAGTVAKAVFKDRAGTEVFRCAVAVSASDINLSGVVMGAGETITISSLTYSVV